MELTKQEILNIAAEVARVMKGDEDAGCSLRAIAREVEVNIQNGTGSYTHGTFGEEVAQPPERQKYPWSEYADFDPQRVEIREFEPVDYYCRHCRPAAPDSAELYVVPKVIRARVYEDGMDSLVNVCAYCIKEALDDDDLGN